MIDTPRLARCRSCRYPLRRLTVARCPECGRPFDPMDRATMRFWSERMGWRWRLAKLQRLWSGRPPYNRQTLRLGVLAFALTMVYVRGQPDSFTAVVALALWAPALWRAVFARCFRHPIHGLARAAIALLVLLSLLFTFGHDECPHGTYLWIGPYLVQTAGPGCGNVRHFHTFLTGRDPAAPASWPE